MQWNTARIYARLSLKKHELGEVDPEKMYDQQSWLNASKDIYDTLGEKNTLHYRQSHSCQCQVPSEIDTLEIGLGSIDIAYYMNHSKGEIGHCQLKEFDAANKRAIMVCNTPYPSEFDRGIIMTMLSKFKPKTPYKDDVQLDTTKETRLKGVDNCTYLVSW